MSRPRYWYEATVNEILVEIQNAMRTLDPEKVEKMVDILIKAKNRKILVLGAGRSGLVGRAFAMRLMHLGFNVYVVGETIAPALEKNDVLFAISGSGTTTLVVASAEIAKKVGAIVVAITSYINSPLGKLADHVVVLKGRTKVARKKDYFSRQILGVHEPLAPLGTLFEASCMIFLDGIIVELMHRLGKTEREMKLRHATIE
ncbi:6-phospho-3-hexuloisomerase [Candidatus Bathyarchaeota archaeon]|nr:6-phospho-3-hexuloisomerase [Candidatus Bathyarchaeota archaeon]